MCGIAGAGKAGRIAGAAAAAALVATRRSLPRDAVDERSLAKKRRSRPLKKPRATASCAARASARDLSLSSSTIGRQNDFRRAARLARLLAINCVTRRLVAYRPSAPKRLPHLTCSVPPRGGGLSLPTALMLPRCVPSPHDTCGVACRPSWLLTQKTTNVALRDNNLPSSLMLASK